MGVVVVVVVVVVVEVRVCEESMDGCMDVTSGHGHPGMELR